MQLAVNPLVYSPNLHTANCRFNVAKFDDAWFMAEKIDLPEVMKCSNHKRRAEYFIGRYLAKQCLAEMGVQQFVLAADSNRCPQWPENLLGSISHSDDTAICVLARKRDYAAIGVDTENWVNADMAKDMCKMVMSPTEQQLGKTIVGDIRYFTHIFSAKESIFKALYPQVGRYFNFSAAQLIATESSQNLLCFELTENLNTTYTKGMQLQVRFNASESGVTTLCLIEHKTVT